ncbi:hypothetical protein [Saccharothrix hoggarensis]|uniref:Cas3 C-terminal domain-containing protein n=1 Tax=Saccharothrix hoggarensis TaxID=913853 RepID=A0ABW3QN52_9PSEU
MTDYDDEFPDTTVDVVLLHAGVDDDGSDSVRPVRGGAVTNLTSTTSDLTVLDALLESSTVLSAPDGVPPEVVSDLLAAPVPHLFASNPWLRQHRALVFHDGQCLVAGHLIRYRPEYGVYVDGYQ